MAQKFVNLVALLSVALVACSFGAQPANALAAHGANAHLNRAEHHALAAKKQRRADASSSKRCRKRPSSTISLTHPTSSASYSSTVAVSTSAAASTTEVSSSAKKTSTIESSSSTTHHTTTQAPPPPPPPSTHSSHTSTHTTTTSSAVATVSPPSGGASGPGKVGLSWPPGQTGLAPYINNNVKYMYSWSPDIIAEAFKYDINTIPMLWGFNQEADFVKNAEKNCKGGYMAFLNEPNQDNQSNMSPQDAAMLYHRSMKQFQDKGYSIIAPATSSNPNGFTWVQDFFKACGPTCKFKAIALHYYDISAQGFIDYIEKWHNEWPDMEVFVTEFACQNFNNGPQCSEGQTWDFWATSIKYMEAQPWLKAYFGFGVMRDMSGVNPNNQLMVPSTGHPTALGATYLDVSWH